MEGIIDTGNDNGVLHFTPRRKALGKPPVFCLDEDSGLGMERVDQPIVWFDEDSGLGMEQMDEMTNELGDGFSLCTRKRRKDKNSPNIVEIKKQKPKLSKQNHRLFAQKSLSFGDDRLRVSEDDAIGATVDIFTHGNDVTGNGCQSFCLPTILGKHPDLKSISAETMIEVLQGQHRDVINRCRIIDCRYPYEYNAGHIQGAINCYTEEQVLAILHEAMGLCHEDERNTRDIIIFYCEFSSERGPKMSRHLRSKDREINKDVYPYLHFPEVYLLHNGYKEFYTVGKNFCTPVGYVPMLDPEHLAELRHFRSSSKSWKTRHLQSRSKTWNGVERATATPMKLTF